MKKILLIFAILLGSLQVVADDYTQLVFKNSDGSLSSITSMGLTITFEEGKMTAVNGDEILVIDIGNIVVMYFSSNSSTPTDGLGDVNKDGIINITDVVLTVNYIIGQTPSDFYEENADVNRDGSITVTDVTYILNLMLGN